MLGVEAELAERGFCVRKTDPCLELWVVVRSLVRRFRNYWGDQVSTSWLMLVKEAGKHTSSLLRCFVPILQINYTPKRIPHSAVLLLWSLGC
jgi:hypothetical protein